MEISRTTLALLLFSVTTLRAGEAPPANRTAAGIDHFTPVDTSRVMGSPDPLLPYDVENAYPQLTFQRPLAFTHAGDETDRVFVVEQDGRILVFPNRRDVKSAERRVFLDLTDVVSREDNEEGLLGLAFHPRYRENGEFYVFYSIKSFDPRGSKVCRFHVSKDDPNRAERTSEQEVLHWSKPYGNHNGGSLDFGPDGCLYIAIGDGGLGGDPHGNGQNYETLLGSVLRIDVDHRADGRQYTIPRDNPFVERGGKVRGELWAKGLRNPWRMAFDPRTGTLWAGDVGQDLWEEIDIIERGKNYGWGLREGRHSFGTNGVEARADLTEPIFEYPHTDGKCITGGVVYRGRRLPELDGAYLFADFVNGQIWSLRRNEKGAAQRQRLVPAALPSITAFGYDGSGEVYCTCFDGSIYRFRRADWSRQLAEHPFPQKLSETGLLASVKSLQPAPGAIPYSVNVPLWSDDASKDRFLALPKADSVIFSEQEQWEFPVGTVLVKTFSLDLKAGDPASRRHLETRLLMHHTWGWDGCTYVWNDQQTEADLLDGALDKKFTVQTDDGPTTQTWHFPSRAECLTCHTPAAKFVLGWNTRQLNCTQDDGTKRENQIARFDRLGLFTKKLLAEPAKLEAFPDWQSNDTPLAERARAYLDVNCAFCHVPGGTGNARIDLRYHTPLAKTLLVGQPPERGHLGPDNSQLLFPGDASRSELLLRIRGRGAKQMPPLGTNEFDPRALQTIGDWIEALPAKEPKAK